MVHANQKLILATLAILSAAVFPASSQTVQKIETVTCSEQQLPEPHRLPTGYRASYSTKANSLESFVLQQDKAYWANSKTGTSLVECGTGYTGKVVMTCRSRTKSDGTVTGIIKVRGCREDVECRTEDLPAEYMQTSKCSVPKKNCWKTTNNQGIYMYKCKEDYESKCLLPNTAIKISQLDNYKKSLKCQAGYVGTPRYKCNINEDSGRHVLKYEGCHAKSGDNFKKCKNTVLHLRNVNLKQRSMFISKKAGYKLFFRCLEKSSDVVELACAEGYEPKNRANLPVVINLSFAGTKVGMKLRGTCVRTNEISSTTDETSSAATEISPAAPEKKDDDSSEANSTENSSDSEETSLPLILGSIFGGAVFCAAVIMMVVCCLRQRKVRAAKEADVARKADVRGPPATDAAPVFAQSSDASSIIHPLVEGQEPTALTSERDEERATVPDGSSH